MKIICKPRGAGKTTELIKESAKYFSYIVCSSQKEAMRIAEQAKNMGLDIPFPLSMEEFIMGRFSGMKVKTIAIDNVEELLYRLTGGIPISAITLTSEE